MPEIGSIFKQLLEVLEAQVKDNRVHFNFRFFKLRKTSVVITLLGLLGTYPNGLLHETAERLYAFVR